MRPTPHVLCSSCRQTVALLCHRRGRVWPRRCSTPRSRAQVAWVGRQADQRAVGTGRRRGHTSSRCAVPVRVRSDALLGCSSRLCQACAPRTATPTRVTCTFLRRQNGRMRMQARAACAVAFLRTVCVAVAVPYHVPCLSLSLSLSLSASLSASLCLRLSLSLSRSLSLSLSLSQLPLPSYKS